MPTICPKCRHMRQPHETVPEWQCPACGVAYIKAEAASRESAQPQLPSTRRESVPTIEGGGIPWGKLILLGALIWGAWIGVQVAKNRHSHSSSIAAALSGDLSVEELKALAATVQPSDVTMYSTTECPYCAQAKSWLNQYGFAFSECNMSVQPECEQEFKSFGATGTPYLVVRGHHMKNGFDSDEFISLLQR